MLPATLSRTLAIGANVEEQQSNVGRVSNRTSGRLLSALLLGRLHGDGDVRTHLPSDRLTGQMVELQEVGF